MHCLGFLLILPARLNNIYGTLRILQGIQLVCGLRLLNRLQAIATGDDCNVNNSYSPPHQDTLLLGWISVSSLCYSAVGCPPNITPSPLRLRSKMCNQVSTIQNTDFSCAKNLLRVTLYTMDECGMITGIQSTRNGSFWPKYLKCIHSLPIPIVH